jgi:hypothetical protein
LRGADFGKTPKLQLSFPKLAELNLHHGGFELNFDVPNLGNFLVTRYLKLIETIELTNIKNLVCYFTPAPKLQEISNNNEDHSTYHTVDKWIVDLAKASPKMRRFNGDCHMEEDDYPKWEFLDDLYIGRKGSCNWNKFTTLTTLTVMRLFMITGYH